MAEVYEVEVVTGETATATVVPASSLQVEVTLESTALVGVLSDIQVVEITIPGTMKVPDDTYVKNVGNAPGLLRLAVGAPVPNGTPAGTIIIRA